MWVWEKSGTRSGQGSLACCTTGLQRAGHEWPTEQPMSERRNAFEAWAEKTWGELILQGSKQPLKQRQPESPCYLGTVRAARTLPWIMMVAARAWQGALLLARSPGTASSCGSFWKKRELVPPSSKEQGPQRTAGEILNTKQLFYLGWGVVSGWWW